MRRTGEFVHSPSRSPANDIVDLLDVPQVAAVRLQITGERDLKRPLRLNSGERRISREAVGRPLAQLWIIRRGQGKSNFAGEFEHGARGIADREQRSLCSTGFQPVPSGSARVENPCYNKNYTPLVFYFLSSIFHHLLPTLLGFPKNLQLLLHKDIAGTHVQGRAVQAPRLWQDRRRRSWRWRRCRYRRSSPAPGPWCWASPTASSVCSPQRAESHAMLFSASAASSRSDRRAL